MSEPNLIHVQSLYAAIGRGDLGAIVRACSPDTVWEVTGRPDDFATFGQWKGHRGVCEYFAARTFASDLCEFSPRSFRASGDKVVVDGREVATLASSGRTAAGDWLHVFTFADGMVTGFREFYDTAQIGEAAQA